MTAPKKSFDTAAKRQARYNRNGFTDLTLSVFADATGAVIRALEKGYDPNQPTKHGLTPLFYAAKHGRRGAAHHLLEHGARVRLADIQAAIESSRITDIPDYSRTDLLLISRWTKQGGRKGTELNRFLHRAAAYNDGSLIKALAAQGADINCRRQYAIDSAHEGFFSPLDVAVGAHFGGRNVSAAQTLLELGATGARNASLRWEVALNTTGRTQPTASEMRKLLEVAIEKEKQATPAPEKRSWLFPAPRR